MACVADVVLVNSDVVVALRVESVRCCLVCAAVLRGHRSSLASTVAISAAVDTYMNVRARAAVATKLIFVGVRACAIEADGFSDLP